MAIESETRLTTVNISPELAKKFRGYIEFLVENGVELPNGNSGSSETSETSETSESSEHKEGGKEGGGESGLLEGLFAVNPSEAEWPALLQLAAWARSVAEPNSVAARLGGATGTIDLPNLSRSAAEKLRGIVSPGELAGFSISFNSESSESSESSETSETSETSEMSEHLDIYRGLLESNPSPEEWGSLLAYTKAITQIAR